jgi:hypothetical protein
MNGVSVWHWLVPSIIVCAVAIVVKFIFNLIQIRFARSTPSVASRLEELENLKSKGFISASEYNLQKSAIIRGV